MLEIILPLPRTCAIYYFFPGSEVELNKKLSLNMLWRRPCHFAAISCAFAPCLY